MSETNIDNLIGAVLVLAIVAIVAFVFYKLIMEDKL